MVSLRALYSIPGCRGLPRAATRKSEFMSANANVQLGTQCFTIMDNVLQIYNLIINESVLQIHNLIVLNKVGIQQQIHNLIIMASAF